MAELASERVIRTGSSHDRTVSLESLTKGEELAKCKVLAERLPEARPDQLVRFLRARDGKVEKACEMLKQHLAWRKEKLPLGLSDDVREEIEKNKYVFFGRDKLGHKVIVARLKLMGKHTYKDLTTVEKSLVIIAEYMESQLEPLEKITVVFSRLEASRENSDLDWVKAAGSLFNNNYPERLRIAVVAPVNMFFRSLWAVAQYFFDPQTREKICLAKDAAVFSEHVDLEQLPKELGGKHEGRFCSKDVLEFAEWSQKTAESESKEN